jgi:hypothetical protein
MSNQILLEGYACGLCDRLIQFQVRPLLMNHSEHEGPGSLQQQSDILEWRAPKEVLQIVSGFVFRRMLIA